MIEPSIVLLLQCFADATTWQEIGHAPWQSLWAACTLLFRARYSVATMLLPGLLAGLALWQRVPGTLYSLLLLRVYEKGEPRISRTLNDIFFITAVSFTVAGLGAMGVRLVQKHGDQRLSTCAVDAGATDRAGTAAGSGPSTNAAPNAAGQPDDTVPAAPGTARTTTPAPATAAADPPGWPGWLLLACGLGALVFPVGCVIVACREQTFRDQPGALWRVLLALVRGGLVVVALAWLLGVARLTVFGPDDWILPFSCDLFAVDRTRGAWLSAPVGRLLTRLGAGAGYVDPAGGLYRSHIDLALVVLVALLVYIVALTRAIRTRKPTYRNASTGIYLLIVIGAAGTVFGGVSFFCDRYGISPPLLAALCAAFNYRFFAVDHYYELFAVPPAGGTRDPAREPPLLATCLAGRSFPKDPDDGKRTMIVATAAGGGIQAAAWAAEVLTGLATTVPHFRDSLGLLSGVSGGSVGCAFYLTGAAHDPATTDTLPDDLADEIRGRARSSLLEAVSWGVAFPETVRLLWGRLPRNVLIDRGWALERALEARLDTPYGTAATGRAATPAADTARGPLRMRDLGARIAAGHLPVPLFNSTVVQTGQRVVIAPVRWFPGPPPRDDGVRSLHLIDDASSSLPADPRLATAVRLSATFSYASPVARPLPPPAASDVSGAEPGPASGDQPTAASEKDRLLAVHLCDGGYADNTGVVSAVEACEAILAGLPAGEPRPFDRILFMRIEPFPLDDRAEPARHEGFWKATLGPVVSLLSARVATQLERADHELERLAAQAHAAHGIEVAWTTIRYGDYQDRERLARPPLSWALSTAQQRAVVAAWEAWRDEAASHPVVQPTLAHGGITTSQVALGSMLRVTRAT